MRIGRLHPPVSSESLLNSGWITDKHSTTAGIGDVSLFHQRLSVCDVPRQLAIEMEMEGRDSEREIYRSAVI